MSFSRNMDKNVDNNISKNFSSKYNYKRLGHVKQSATEWIKNASESNSKNSRKKW